MAYSFLFHTLSLYDIGMWFVFPFSELTLILKKGIGRVVVGKWVLGWILAQGLFQSPELEECAVFPNLSFGGEKGKSCSHLIRDKET
ncbi:hypothetical protein VNO77_16984 [Canavalia gladiata]|uniref:Uncharacterized protein n=1 Tax=Canavalia gladiata TaxID=3824 RepID=A0AAN9LN22_CANGL